MQQSAIWLPPSDCGCKIRIDADFPDGSVVNGFASRHPVPYTITSLEIVSCCDRHKSAIKGGMPDVDHLFDVCNISGDDIQRRGYLKFPIEDPSDAEILYQYLCGHKGQVHSYPCGCRAYMWGDFSGNFHYIEKDGVTQKCLKHKNDTVDMAQAKADFEASIPKTDDTAQPE